MKKYNYPVRIYLSQIDETVEWVAEYPDLSGCIGVGETPEEALSEAKLNQEVWIEAALENGEKLPHPSDSYSNEYSGKFNLRLSKSLHKELAIRAELEGVSLNTLCSGYLQRALSGSPSHVF